MLRPPSLVPFTLLCLGATPTPPPTMHTCSRTAMSGIVRKARSRKQAVGGLVSKQPGLSPTPLLWPMAGCQAAWWGRGSGGLADLCILVTCPHYSDTVQTPNTHCPLPLAPAPPYLPEPRLYPTSVHYCKRASACCAVWRRQCASWLGRHFMSCFLP